MISYSIIARVSLELGTTAPIILDRYNEAISVGGGTSHTAEPVIVVCSGNATILRLHSNNELSETRPNQTQTEGLDRQESI
jgi:hypothetical protein